MKSQHHLNHDITPNLNKQGFNKVKPYYHKEKGYNGLGLSHSKKGIIQFGIIALVLVGLVIGAYVLFKPASATSDFTTPQRPSTTKISNSIGLKGFLTDVRILNKDNKESVIFNLNEPLKVVGKFHAETEGDYYIEFGIPKSSRVPLTILKSSQSACDGARNYAGVWFNNARAGDVQDFELTITDVTETGTYDLGGGVYSRCGVGADIASIETIKVKFLTSQPITTTIPPTNSNTNPPSTTQPAVCTPSGYFKQLWVRKMGDSSSSDNFKARVAGQFKNNAPCSVTYYIEAGMLESSFKSLATIPLYGGQEGKPSSCDGNVHFSGLKVTLGASGSNTDTVTFNLYPANYGKDGRYQLGGGVYNKDGQFCGFGANIASFPYQEVVFAGFAQSVIDNSWERII